MISEQEQILQYCYHTDQDYHEVIFRQASRRVVDAYLQQMQAMTARVQSGELNNRYMRILLDFSPKGMFPIRYAQERLLPMVKQSPGAQSITLYVAYIATNPIDVSLIRSFFMLIADDNTRRIFAPHERERAIEWLLSMPQA